MSDLYMRGRKHYESTRQTKSHGKGRVCETDGCERILSMYNDNTKCFNHAPAKQPRIRGREDPRKKK